MALTSASSLWITKSLSLTTQTTFREQDFLCCCLSWFKRCSNVWDCAWNPNVWPFTAVDESRSAARLLFIMMYKVCIVHLLSLRINLLCVTIEKKATGQILSWSAHNYAKQGGAVNTNPSVQPNIEMKASIERCLRSVALRILCFQQFSNMAFCF